MQNDIIQTLAPQRMRMHDDYYFRHIFKKTEKICRAVFYISSSVPTSVLVREVEQAALALLKVATDSLREHVGQGSDTSTFTLAYIDLESKLGLLAAAGAISHEHFNVFVQQVDIAKRALHGHTSVPEKSLLIKKSVEPRVKVSVPQKDAPAPAGQTRLDRIQNVLKVAPSASIKDITSSLTDVSEKTIQRDLISLIAQGTVRKEGEKRWSRYSLA